jgi:hypothetical protein
MGSGYLGLGKTLLRHLCGRRGRSRRSSPVQSRCWTAVEALRASGPRLPGSLDCGGRPWGRRLFGAEGDPLPADVPERQPLTFWSHSDRGYRLRPRPPKRTPAQATASPIRRCHFCPGPFRGEAWLLPASRPSSIGLQHRPVSQWVRIPGCPTSSRHRPRRPPPRSARPRWSNDWRR